MKKKLTELREQAMVMLEHEKKEYFGNIEHNTKWKIEILFKLSVMIRIYNTLLGNGKIDEMKTEQVIDYLHSHVINNSQLMDRSSNPISAFTSLWEKETYLEIVDKIKWGI